MIFFNAILRYFIEGSLQFSINALISMNSVSLLISKEVISVSWIQLDFGTTNNRFSSLISILFMTISIGYPIFISIFLRLNFQKLDEDLFKQKYSSLYEGLDTNQTTSILFYTFFTFRRLIFAISAVSLTGQPTAQIFLLFMQCLLVIIYVGVFQPFEQKFQNKLEIFNEICIVVVCYHLMLCTDFISNPVLQYEIGWSLIGVTGLNIGVNMGILLIMGSIDAKNKIKVLWLKLKDRIGAKNQMKVQKYDLANDIGLDQVNNINNKLFSADLFNQSQNNQLKQQDRNFQTTNELFVDNYYSREPLSRKSEELMQTGQIMEKSLDGLNQQLELVVQRDKIK